MTMSDDQTARNSSTDPMTQALDALIETRGWVIDLVSDIRRLAQRVAELERKIGNQTNG